MKRNDKTTRLVSLSDTRSLLEFGADRRTRRDIEAHKRGMLRFETKCVNKYGLSRGGLRLTVSQTRTPIADAAILRYCIECETEIVCAAAEAVEPEVAMWMRPGCADLRLRNDQYLKGSAYRCVATITDVDREPRGS